ncbi:MAG: hypothetical protein Q7R99_00220 [bacterium]|nr:hypothetical protein [bacterium]
MTKNFLFFLIFIVLLPTQFSLATTTTQYDEAKNILQRITGDWKKINDWGVGVLWEGKLVTHLKETLKQGWAEERQEYSQDIFKILGVAWGKVKSFLFHR